MEGRDTHNIVLIKKKHYHYTRREEIMTTKIIRVNQIAKEKPNEVFTSIYHLINKELLLECFHELDGNKAKGIDNVSKEDYLRNLDENLDNLVLRLKNKGYRPSPARRVEIPKANGKTRNLAIANFEDKIVQMAVKKLLEAIYEPKFTNNMFGFRPNKNCHDALRYLNQCIENKYTNYILDADIKGYFDNINHDKLIACLEIHIKDSNLLRLIKRFLKAGIIENGEYEEGEEGTPQGSILSPILANIYMYYSIILWFEKIKKQSKGYMEIINYADDIVMCFQYKREAEDTYQKMINRLKICSLEFAEDKTKLIEFGRFAKENRKRKGLGKPETFEFLGFTHYCSESKKTSKFRVKRKTSKKKMKKAISKFKTWIKKSRNKKLNDIMVTVKRKLVGYYNYYGITDNIESNKQYYRYVNKQLFKWLNRRSQKGSYNKETFNQIIEVFNLPKPKIKVNIYAI